MTTLTLTEFAGFKTINMEYLSKLILINENNKIEYYTIQRNESGGLCMILDRIEPYPEELL